MKIAIVTIGTRGDVEPFVAFGEGLVQSGHSVKIVTHAMFESFVKERGLGFHILSGNVQEALNTEEVRETVEKSKNPAALFNKMKEVAAPLVVKAVNESLDACKGMDHLICTPISIYLTYFLSLELSIPISIGAINPAGPTKYFHNPVCPPPAAYLPGFAKHAYNIATHLTIGQLAWHGQRPLLNDAWQQVFGHALPVLEPLLSAFKKMQPLLLYGYSKHVLPKPVDWVKAQQVTGYWFLKPKPGWQPPQELVNFIENGARPIYIGFGSTNADYKKKGELNTLILETLKQTRQRAIVLKSEFADESVLPENVFAINNVPFGYLFPKMAAVVHHGGAGTTAIGLKAATPTIIVPMIYDQKFWAWNIEKLNIAPQPIQWKSLSVETLSGAINTALANNTLKTNALELSKKITTENGVENAVRIFNRHI